MSTLDYQAIRQAQRTPYAPQMESTLYLYDQAEPRVVPLGGNFDHVSVEVTCGPSRFRLASWTPDTLRRFAAVCSVAAASLEQARERRIEQENVA